MPPYLEATCYVDIFLLLLPSLVVLFVLGVCVFCCCLFVFLCLFVCLLFVCFLLLLFVVVVVFFLFCFVVFFLGGGAVLTLFCYALLLSVSSSWCYGLF